MSLYECAEQYLKARNSARLNTDVVMTAWNASSLGSSWCLAKWRAAVRERQCHFLAGKVSRVTYKL